MNLRPRLVVPLLFAAATGLAASDVSWLPDGIPPAPPVGRPLGAFLKPEQGQAVLDAALAHFPDRASWDAYAQLVRRRIQEGAGLSPWPKRTPLNAVIHSRRLYDGYSVENVYFESAPGNYVTGNLYRPLNVAPPYAGILSPHGHTGPVVTPEDFAKQGRFEPEMQRRCASLAKMGAVVFSIDMFGCDDSMQIVGQDAHRQPLAFTIQTWNSTRAIDFLLAQDGVDPKRIGVSGYSGGGTQTFIVAALDPRVAVSVPVTMVSAYNFGGCPCESGQPIHRSPDHFVSNAMIAALAAPRPMLLVSDGKDWTQYTPKIEFPFIEKIYAYYGAAADVANVHLPDEGHDYGPSKRAAAYRFFAAHLGMNLAAILGPDGRIDESRVTIEKPGPMHVFDSDHPIPPNALHTADAIAAELHKLQ
ncbi:MAG TPA: acetylxylan esterase [Opitutaceae bacterium]|nr:acetylxylan esterase [Opitutaceae bacterium]